MTLALLAGLLASATTPPNPATLPAAPPIMNAPAPDAGTVAAPVVVAPPIVPHHRTLPTPAEFRVRAANRAATLEPQASGYIDAVQVYPFSDGAIFHVFTRPAKSPTSLCSRAKCSAPSRRATQSAG